MNGFRLIKIMSYILPVFFIIGGGITLILWFQSETSITIDKRQSPISSTKAHEKQSNQVDLKGTFERFTELSEVKESEHSWSRFRGELYDNVVESKVSLVSNLSSNNLKMKWSIDLGEGYAGAAVKSGLVYVLDYMKDSQSDALRAFSLDSGKEIWRRSYKVQIKRNHGMSRTVPTVTDQFVVSMGPKCHVLCLDSKTGDFKWGIDLVLDYGTKVPLWYTAQCPLVDGDQVVLAPGGKNLMMGVDIESGELMWTVPNPDNWQMSHSSIIPMTFFDHKMYVYCALGGIVAVSAEQETLGELMWTTTEWNHSVVSPSPVNMNNHQFLVTAGYGEGSMIFEVMLENGKFKAKSLKKFKPDEFACEQHTPIFHKRHLFTILPSDGGAYHKQFVCMDQKGSIKYRSGDGSRFGLGPFILADDKFFIIDDHGVLTIAQLDFNEYIELSKLKILDGRESWGPLAITDGLLIARDFTKMICVDLNR